jgi:glyoxylase-like metal-dependent hydrolase (beta-lactamase superfamily II)/rhodanese-related sulfurtransferase
MIFKQYYLGCLSHASYMIGDEETATAVIVDPQRDIDEYVDDAKNLGLEIKYVFLTHFHADFVAGHLELRDRVGAKVCLGTVAQAEFETLAFKDGESLEFGKIRMKIIDTPGHTPEGISILVYDLAKSSEIPHSILTGDTLFIGDVGRPDLLGSLGFAADDLAGMLYRSIKEKILPLPDETLVYPAHGAGSMCGRALSTETVSTMGEQRKYNYALQPMSEAEFTALVTADQPDAPQYFVYDAIMNRKERQTLDESLQLSLKPLGADELLRQQREGAHVLDVREPADYEGAHVANSINIGLSGRFATFAGILLDSDTPIVIVADPGREEEAALRLGRIGYDHVVGYLEGGMAALASREEVTRRTERITPATVDEHLRQPDPPAILDVRTENEFQGMRIEGSLNIPLHHLLERIGEVPTDRPVVVHCESGYRSAMAMGILERHGLTNATHMVGGIAAWGASRLATVS